jgi:hypothetical protein
MSKSSNEFVLRVEGKLNHWYILRLRPKIKYCLFVVLLQTIKILYLSKLYAYLIVTQRVMWAIAITDVRPLLTCHILFILSKTTEPVGTKLWRNDTFEVLNK